MCLTGWPTFMTASENARGLLKLQPLVRALSERQNISAASDYAGRDCRVTSSTGDHGKALQHHELALSIFKTVGDRRMEIVELKEMARFTSPGR